MSIEGASRSACHPMYYHYTTSFIIAAESYRRYASNTQHSNAYLAPDLP